jgi:hypothetical protein
MLRPTVVVSRSDAGGSGELVTAEGVTQPGSAVHGCEMALEGGFGGHVPALPAGASVGVLLEAGCELGSEQGLMRLVQQGSPPLEAQQHPQQQQQQQQMRGRASHPIAHGAAVVAGEDGYGVGVA